MSRIEELTNALQRGRAIFDEIMGRSTSPDFRTEELYVLGEESEDSLCSYEECGTIASADNIEYMEYLLKKRGMAGKIQLVYADPPFFSNSRYQASVVINSNKLGRSPLIKTGAYDDKWGTGTEQYLTMMTVSLLMMRELIADTGCIWVHLDWHGSHYVKLILDEIFGNDNFVNEVIWTYKSGGASGKCFAKKHDTLLMYSKGRSYKFNRLKEKSYNRGLKPYRFKGVEEFRDEKGWYTMVNMKDVWNIDMVGRTSGERTGYATQKPEKLLERILLSCSDEGDLCADFFAGSGTLGAAAQKMGRKWIMCDCGAVAAASQIQRICGVVSDSSRPERVFKVVRKNDNSQGRAYDTSNASVDIRQTSGRIEISGYRPDLSGLAKGDVETACKYLADDSRDCISFWSVDSDYDGDVHRCSRILKATDSASAGMRSIHVTGYDVFGNRFCWERIK